MSNVNLKGSLKIRIPLSPMELKELDIFDYTHHKEEIDFGNYTGALHLNRKATAEGYSGWVYIVVNGDDFSLEELSIPISEPDGSYFQSALFIANLGPDNDIQIVIEVDIQTWIDGSAEAYIGEPDISYGEIKANSLRAVIR